MSPKSESQTDTFTDVTDATAPSFHIIISPARERGHLPQGTPAPSFHISPQPERELAVVVLETPLADGTSGLWLMTWW